MLKRYPATEKELKEKANQLLSKCEEAVAVENELNARTKDVENVKLDRATELELVQKLKDKIRILLAQLANVDFTYHDPMKNFDRTRVKGVVAKLIKVKDGSTMTALEVGKGNAEVALSLVGYDQELKSAMEYVFGSTFVCKTIDAMREMAFFLLLLCCYVCGHVIFECNIDSTS
ncbi:hypothetical protein HYC85_013659 [Camellia sinensis]|uniref:SMC hinge domain-containing protein n=1 Tax=Camellia sinensis TaxID=4442 RepID=A0A7J7H3Y3_CAMSI|nr:hypothetical protein HYC85_013659 [Camellia sinensis]